MLFNSYPFVVLVLMTLAIYYLKSFSRFQVPILVIASAVFYGYNQPALLILLFLSASINAMTSFRVRFEKTQKRRRIFAGMGIIANLLVLSLFKYTRLLAEISGGVSAQDDQLLYFVTMLPLPIGISFYTFQGISLVMDVYKDQPQKSVLVDPSFPKHFLNSIFFTAFFPQLVAGPIVKAHDFLPQITHKSLKNVDLYSVYRYLVAGYFLKSVIADNLKDQTFWISAPYFESHSSWVLIVMLVGYSMQIFADFAGYSLIAIGIGALFGYRLPQNFDFPYISLSIAEFWRRWHISLSSWLKEYLYIGLLGGNRKGTARTYVNLLLVMFLGGLWHGAAISYGVWGLWHGTGLIIERAVSAVLPMPRKSNPLVRTLRILAVFTFVSVGWLLFKLPNFRDAIDYLQAIQDNGHIRVNVDIVLNVTLYALPVFIYHILYLSKHRTSPWLVRVREYDYVAYALMLFAILTNGGIPGDFVYFQF